ncbi:MAG: hypothetical protein KGL02_00815 [Acidobacteriota bacterium]|nr:hypothetical protein [Acidobacteriota bacterium]MDE3171162.1 hypothetical protein [Acidobacteriota bacterium]
MKINRRRLLSLLGTSPMLVAGSNVAAETRKKGARGERGSAEKFTAVNPKGTPPPVHRFAMAPRLDTLNGKTIYLVDTGFFGGGLLLHQMQDWFQENMPGVKTVFRKKAGGWAADDPPLWAEIKARGNAVIMAIGH